MPAKTIMMKSTLVQSQDAAREIFHEAATAWPTVRRYHAGKSAAFPVIEQLDPTLYADFAAWILTLDSATCPDRWRGFGPQASDHLLAYTYRRLAHASDESIAKLMDAFRTKEFRGPSTAERVDLLQSFLARHQTQPLPKKLLADVETLATLALEGSLRVKSIRVRQQEAKARRELKSLLTNVKKPRAAKPSR